MVTSWLANSILPLGLALLLPSENPANANLTQRGEHGANDEKIATKVQHRNECLMLRLMMQGLRQHWHALGGFIRIKPLEGVAKQDL